MKSICIFFAMLATLLPVLAQTNDATAPQSTVAPSAPAAPDTNAPAAVATVPAAPADSAMTASNPPPASVGIPQIKFADVPITTAIENLARLANINYMLDPKIGYGQPDVNGQIKTEPTLSIRWENITAESALQALLDNYGLQLIHDKHTGIDRITMKDPTAPPALFTKVVQLKYASVSNMIDAAQSTLQDHRSRVLTDPRTSQLVIVATESEQLSVEALINQLDKPTRQVLIETRLVEISSNPKTQKGVDWTKTLGAQNVSFGNGQMVGTWGTTFPGTSPGKDGAGNPLPATGNSQGGTLNNTLGGGGFSWNTKSGTTPNIGFLNADGLNVVLSFLNSSSEAQVVSTPRIVTMDNETATISVTRTYPVFQVAAGTANSSGGSSVNYSNVGTILHVTPRISANDYIWLRVYPEVSSFFGNFSATLDGKVYQAPQFDTRSVQTDVLVPNSNTLVIGGLVQDNPHADYTKVPLLGDVPGLGFLFRSSSKSLSKDNLLIFITPTIVRDSDFQTSQSTDFLKSKTLPIKEPMDPRTAWDSPVPRGQWIDPITDTTK